MPNNEELEKIALKLWCISGREEGFIHHKNLGSSEYIHIMRIAAFHTRERDIAVIKAKLNVIQDITISDVENGFEMLTSELQEKLTALKKDSYVGIDNAEGKDRTYIPSNFKKESEK